MKIEVLVGEKAGVQPFVVAALGALPVLLLLCCAAPLGSAWRWREIDVDAVLVAAALGLIACFRRSGAAVMLVLLGTPSLVLARRLVNAWLALKHYDAMEHFGDDAEIEASASFGAVGPWLAAGLYASIAWLAIGRTPGHADAADRNLLKIAAWTGALAVVGFSLGLATEDWYTLENLSGSGTYISGVAWPDTKVLALVVSAITLLVSATLAGRALLRRRERRAFLSAVAAGHRDGWHIRPGTEAVPALLDSLREPTWVLVQISGAGEAYRKDPAERPVGRVEARS